MCMTSFLYLWLSPMSNGLNFFCGSHLQFLWEEQKTFPTSHTFHTVNFVRRRFQLHILYIVVYIQWEDVSNLTYCDFCEKMFPTLHTVTFVRRRFQLHLLYILWLLWEDVSNFTYFTYCDFCEKTFPTSLTLHTVTFVRRRFQLHLLYILWLLWEDVSNFTYFTYCDFCC